MSVTGVDSSMPLYAGDGSTTEFAFTFLTFNETDLTVVLADSDGVESTLELTTHYTVDLDEVGGSVTLLTAPAVGEVLSIRRVVDITQTLVLMENDPMPSSLLERQLDRTTMQIQQMNEEISRQLSYSVTTAEEDRLSATDFITALSAERAAAENAAAAAGISETNAAVSASSATAEATNAAAEATNAAASAILAQQWANEDEDTEVADGEYSAKHYATKAAESAADALANAGFPPISAGDAGKAVVVNGDEDGYTLGAAGDQSAAFTALTAVASINEGRTLEVTLTGYTGDEISIEIDVPSGFTRTDGVISGTAPEVESAGTTLTFRARRVLVGQTWSEWVQCLVDVNDIPMVTDDAVEWSEDTDDYPAALSTNATPGTYQMDVTGDVMKELEVDAASTTQSLVLTHAQGGMLAEGDVLVLDDDTLFEVPAGMAEEVEGTINEAVEPSGDGTAGGTGFTWTLLDPNISLGAGDVVTDIGLYVESPGTYTGCIVRQESATDYTVMATCSIVHSGVGYQYGALSSAYVVPNDGYTYRIATVQPAPSNNSLAVGSGYRSYSGSASTIGSQYTFSSVVSGYVPCNAWKVDISRYTYTMTPAAALDSVPSEARKLPAIKLASGKKAYEAGSKIGDNNATGTAMIEFVSSTSGGMETGDEFICDAESIVRTAIVSEIDNGDSTYTYTLTDISPALSSTPTSIYLPQVVQFEEEDFVARGIASIVKSTPETEFYTGGTIAASTALTRMSTGAQLPVKRISHLGFSTSTACTGTIFIMQDATAPDFTVIDSVSLTHTGSGEMEYVELDEHFDVPSTGYFLAVHVNTAADNLLTSSGTGGYYIAGGASGTQTWTAFSGNDVCCGYKTTQYLVTCDKQEFDFEDEIRRIAAGITADDFSAYTATIEQGEGEGDWATATLALVLTETGFKTTTSSMEEYSA